MKKLMLMPQYVQKFRCIGSACEDTCCAGWKVSIDEDTYKKYKRVEDYDLKKKLEKFVGRDRTTNNKHGKAKIRLQGGRCPFLMENELCEIHSKLGEGYLSNTCAIYPRIHKQVNGVVEQSLTMSCPEAARVALSNSNVMEFDQLEYEFTTRDIGIKDIKLNPIAREWKDYFWDVRMFVIGTLQNREYTLEERLLILGLFFDKLQNYVAYNQLEDIPSLIQDSSNKMLSGIYKGTLRDIPALVDIQLKLAKALVDIRYNMKITSAVYRDILVEMLQGLHFNDGVEIEENIEVYKDAYTKYYNDFMKDNGHIVENYLVNYTFKELMPIDTAQPFESYVKFILHYALLKLHFIGVANKEDGLTVEKSLQIIQSLSKTYEHNQSYFNQLLKVLEENEYNKLSYMTILIKN